MNVSPFVRLVIVPRDPDVRWIKETSPLDENLIAVPADDCDINALVGTVKRGGGGRHPGARRKIEEVQVEVHVKHGAGAIRTV